MKASPELILENLLAKAASCTDAAEAYYLSSEDSPIEFENNRLKSLLTKYQQGVALRVVVNGKIGFASSTDLSRLEDLVAAAVQTTEVGELADFDFASNFHLQSIGQVEQPSMEQLMIAGDRLISEIHTYNPDILVSVNFHVRSRVTAIATSSDVMAKHCSYATSATLGGNLVKNEDFLQVYTYDIVGSGEPDYLKICQQLIQKYSWAETSTTIRNGRLPVLFTPRAVASVIGGLFDTILSGQLVVQQASPLANKLGETIFDPRLSIFEDPSIGVSACPFDDEGTPTTAKTFIERGKVQGFYWDRCWAARAGKQSTGNGFRSGLSRPTPDTLNVCIAAGQAKYNDLIASMNEGLIVDQVLGAMQSNRLAGEFSVNLDLGYKVERGKIVGRVKDTMVSGNIFEAFLQIIDISDKPEWVGSSAFMPAILFAELGVSTRNV